MEPKTIQEALQEPFPPEDIEWRVGATNSEKTKGIALAYITNRAIQSRLDDLFGPFGWRNEFREWKGTSQLCGISIKFGDEWITKWDGADDSQTEAVKGGLSDAMKRAGYQWGIGRYLYRLENIWVPIKQAGRSYVIVSEPELPEWALPEGYKKTKKPERKTDIPPAALKAKYQTGKGSLEGFEEWVKAMQEKGLSYQAMENVLAQKLNEKKGATQSA